MADQENPENTDAAEDAAPEAAAPEEPAPEAAAPEQAAPEAADATPEATGTGEAGPTDRAYEAAADETAASEGAAPEATAAEPEATAADEPAPAGDVEDGAMASPPAQTATPAAPAAPQAPPSTPKERKVVSRARRGTRRPATPEERNELRRQKAAARSRRRASEKAKRGEARGEGTPPADHGTRAPKVRLGKVVSDKADKTITVRIDVARRHRRYQKIVRSSTTLHAHDERNDANEGDLVRVVEARPMSRTKRWRLVEILERAK
jgi:small subunit ribosomal protein S17